MDKKTLASRYETILRQRGMRPDTLRLHVLEVLSGEENFFDRADLVSVLQKSAIQPDDEKVRYVIKRLQAAGFLDRKPVAKRNKFLFRLWPVETLEKEFSPR